MFFFNRNFLRNRRIDIVLINLINVVKNYVDKIFNRID